MATKSVITDPVSGGVIYIASGIWQGVGWGTIIYLAAITNVDAQLYEAAKNRRRKTNSSRL
ncbi:MAG: hypothetical protein L6V93_22555 [Clostridiales bacterium]|nr:MAG: hypothetical protein L6V93_22555 [Clostridiales bacterium]